MEVKNNKTCWTIENENYTIYYGNYEDNINLYNTVIDLINIWINLKTVFEIKFFIKCL